MENRSRIKRPFLDSSILVTAFHATKPLHEKAVEILGSEDLIFLSTSLVELELTQPQFSPGQKEEADFHLDYMTNFVSERLEVTEDIVVSGLQTARLTQAAGLDAMHLTCAIEMNADQFITAEKPGKPMYREKRIPVVYLGNL